MITSKENESAKTSQGANGPARKLKDYGVKAYAPLFNLITRYQEELTPYLKAVASGFDAGAKKLSEPHASEAEKYVSGIFRMVADGLDQACAKIEARDPKALGSYLIELAETKPTLMFSTSYAAGVFLGRLGRHIAIRAQPNSASEKVGASDQKSSKLEASQLSPEPPLSGQSIQ